MPYLLLLFVLLSTWNAAIAWTSAREPRMLKTTRIASFHSRSDAPSPSRFQQFSVTKLQKALATIITTSGVALALQGPHAAIAAVGEGDLPAGPLAQMKVLKLKVLCIFPMHREGEFIVERIIIRTNGRAW